MATPEGIGIRLVWPAVAQPTSLLRSSISKSKICACRVLPGPFVTNHHSPVGALLFTNHTIVVVYEHWCLRTSDIVYEHVCLRTHRHNREFYLIYDHI